MWTLWLALDAQAGVFSKKTMHAPWPERQTEAEWVLPRGWMRAELAADTKSTRRWRDENGDLQRHGNDTRWTYSRAWLKFDLGFSRRIRLYVHVPFVQAQLTNSLGTRITRRALGDVHSGAVFQPVLEKRLAVAGKLDLKAPSGVEWPDNFLGGPTGTEGFLTGTGVTNVGVHALVRGLVTPTFALRLDAAFVWKIPAITGYVVEKDGFGNGWLDPGDEIRIHPEIAANITNDLMIAADARVSTRTIYRIGISGEGVARTQMTTMPGTAGTFVDLGLSASWELGEVVDFTLRGRHQIVGADTTHFAALGLEEFSPQPGTELGLGLGARW